MSSDEDDSSQRIAGSRSFTSAPNNGASANKKRRLMRACDFCRRKKIKCDAPDKREGEKCTACVVHTQDCTFMEGAKKRGPPRGYLEYVENRMDRMEEAMKMLAPTYDIESNIGHRYTQSSWTAADHHVNPPPLPNRPVRPPSPVKHQPQPSRHASTQPDLFKHQCDRRANHTFRGLTQSSTSSPAAHNSSHESEDLDSSGEEGFKPARFFGLPEDEDLPEQFSKLELGTSPFFGKSSNVRLLHHAMRTKNEMTGRDDGIWPKLPAEQAANAGDERNPWESLEQLAMPPADRLKFPPQDLSDALIKLYFRHFHPFFPTLHQPSFEAQVRDGMHQKYTSFGLQFLLVCAVGSRWSVDPRVCETPKTATPAGGPVNWKIAGWPYFSQVVHFRHPLGRTLRLHDLQNTLLFSFFGLATQAPHSMLLVAGLGVRYAMDLGAHRRKAYRPERPFQNEIWKRTFWCLVNLDRATSGSLGRPAAVNDEDIDAELPLDVDDNCWDESLQAWRPSDKPSQMQFFIQTTKLSQITAFAMRTLYSLTRSRAHFGVGEDWHKQIVAELDSALNSWIDNIPDHLRWDPNIADPIFFNQAVTLNILYHNAQIVIHRRFLPGPSKKPSSLAFVSLAICTNAARSISHIIDAHLKWIVANKDLEPPYVGVVPINLGAAFLAAVVLLIAIWGAKKSGGNVDTGALADDVQKISRYIKLGEERHFLAARLLETLRELASVGDFPMGLDVDSPPARSASKRSRNDADDSTQSLRKSQSETNSNLPLNSSTIPLSLNSKVIATSTGDWSQPQSYSLPLGNVPNPAPPNATQHPFGRSTLDSAAAKDAFPVPLNLFSTELSTSGTQLPWLNLSNPFTPSPWATGVTPIGQAASLPGSSDLAGPSNSGPLGIPSTQNFFTTGAPATGGNPPLCNAVLGTAYSMLMANASMGPKSTEESPDMGGADTIDPAAAAYFKALTAATDVGYEYPNQVLGMTPELSGPDGGQANVWNSNPVHSQPMATDALTSSVTADWTLWMEDSWGLFPGEAPT